MNKQRIVFGAGIFGKKYFDTYHDDFEINAFCDNSAEKQKDGYLGLPVISINEIVSHENTEIVIACKNHLEVVSQFIATGIRNFVLYSPETIFKPIEIDLTPYNSFETIAHKVALVEVPTGGNCYALKKYCDQGNLNLCLIAPLDNGAKYYDLLTAEMIVTQNAEYVPSSKKHIETWHGFTIKCIYNMVNVELIQKQSWDVRKNIEHVSRIISYSQLYTIFLSSCFGGIDLQKFEVTGMPRCDMLFRSNGREFINELFSDVCYQKIIVYAPTYREFENATYRDEGDGIIFSWDDYDADKLEDFLLAENALLLVKAHFRELTTLNMKSLKQVRIIDDELLNKNGIHFYELLSGADVLISDYSSIWVDYLLLNRPIVFAVRDLDKYEREHGLMTLPFDEWAPGDMVTDFNGLLEAVKRNINNPDLHIDSRKRMARIFHKYQDGNSSERVLALIRKVIDGKVEE